MVVETQRVRDPIHGLIVFDKNDDTDMLAWRLIQTPEFQRLRRIKQLGVSDFVFPGATHSRFAHSIGVYHNARKLMKVIHESKGGAFDEKRARVILIASLLHDVGHGPFSHAFEGARERLAKGGGHSTIEKHEKFTAQICLDDGGELGSLLKSSGLAEDISKLIAAEEPEDIYHAVVSSSFDADRLDYLMRDRYMTGTQAGSIDYDWLIDNLITYDIECGQEGDSEIRKIPTFVFNPKGRQAAEDFLLARYRLYTQVYFHKTTRGIEQIITALIFELGKLVDERGVDPKAGLSNDHPLVVFLKPGGDSLANYKNLDDTVLWGAIERLRFSQIEVIKEMASRLWNRKHLEVLDVVAESGHDVSELSNSLAALEAYTHKSLNKTVFKDDPPCNLYSRIGGEEEKMHKMVRVKCNGGIKEITDFPDSIINKELQKKQRLTRYYFLSVEEKNAALKAMKGR